MVDNRLPLEVNSNPIDTATPIRQANHDQQQNAMNSQRVLQQHYQNMNEREKMRLQHTIVGATRVKSYLDNGDVDGAHEFLVNRREALHQRMATGENIDTQETDAAIEMLRTGNIEELQNNINGLMAAGQVYGVIGGGNAPANVKEWQYFNGLPPEDQQRYLNMKRSNQTLNLGGSQMVVGADGNPVANYQVTPKPEQMPNFKMQQAQATAEGKAQGEKNSDLGRVTENAQFMLNTIDDALSDKEGMEATTGGMFGLQGIQASTMPLGEAQRRYQPKIDQLKGQTFLQAYQSLKGGGQITEVEGTKAEQAIARLNQAQNTADFEAALKDLREIVVTGLQRAQSESTGGISTPQAQQRVRVSNPQTGEVFEIDASDLTAAQAEGFVQQ